MSVTATRICPIAEADEAVLADVLAQILLWLLFFFGTPISLLALQHNSGSWTVLSAQTAQIANPPLRIAGAGHAAMYLRSTKLHPTVRKIHGLSRIRTQALLR